nr:helix-turn-helix domain-containing protein [uncultured Lichenicoccus sp.]
MSEDKLRADARLNRGRILDVARAALAANPEASLNSIGKAAGVGAGTLYRHFPSRDALLVAVYRQEVDALVALAPTLLAEHAPLRALRLWCDRFAEVGRVKQGIAEILRSASDQDIRESYWPLVAAVRRLMDACEQGGEISPGPSPEDVLVLLSTVLRIAPTQDGREQVDRVLSLIFRSLTLRS